MSTSFLSAYVAIAGNHVVGVPLAAFAEVVRLPAPEVSSTLELMGEHAPSLMRIVSHPDRPEEQLVTLTQRGHIELGSHPCLTL
jgi:hypothetical protein